MLGDIIGEFKGQVTGVVLSGGKWETPQTYKRLLESIVQSRKETQDAETTSISTAT
jgi:hypothetical protein